MATEIVQAYAKLNLSLDVLGKRADGFHDLRMVMTSVSLTDTITLETGTGKGVSASSNLGFLPTGEKNLAAAALLRFQEASGQQFDGVHIHLKKQIPVCAGMGGGSSDAAAVLRAVNQLSGNRYTPLELAKIGEAVGSDVPYCVLGGTALAEGRGEVLTVLPPLPQCHIVICKPFFPISTPELFRQVDSTHLRFRPDTSGLISALEQQDLAGVARRMYNVFEDVLSPRQSTEVQAIKKTLLDCEALGASMSGTGPTVFGLFSEEEQAKVAWTELKGQYRDCFLAQVAESP